MMEGGEVEEDFTTPGYLLSVEQREREEMEFFTDLAMQEMQRWIEAVTRKRFRHPEDPKSSLADGILLCETLNAIVPGSVKRINKLPTAMAGIDNLNVFINTCKSVFHLKQAQLFSPFDLHDKLGSQGSDDSQLLSPADRKEQDDRKLRDVAVAIFWLARQVQGIYKGPELDFTNFTALVNARSPNSSQNRDQLQQDITTARGHRYGHSRDSSHDSLDSELMMRDSSRDEYKPYRQRELSTSSFDSGDNMDHGRSSSCSGTSANARRTSAGVLVDPLQFITSRPAQNLALKAKEQMEVAENTKRGRVSIDKDEGEWQTNLSSWKMKRKKSSTSMGPEREANRIFDSNSNPITEIEKPQPRSYDYSDNDDVMTFRTIQATESSPVSTNEFLPSIVSDQFGGDKSVEDNSPRRQEPDDVEEIDNGEGSSNESSGEEEEDDPLIRLLERASIQQAEQKAESGIQNKRLKLETAPSSDEGYGFVIKGGKDKCCPITVEAVSSASVAEECGLEEGDEIIEINGEVVMERNRGYCMLLINGSLQSTGVLELHIKRDTNAKALNNTSGSGRKVSNPAAAPSLFSHYQSASQPASDQTAFAKYSPPERESRADIDDQIAIDRQYKSILDGGYESGISTLRSEDASFYRPINIESGDSPSVSGSMENSSSQDLISPAAEPQAYTENETEVIQHRVSRDFDEVFTSPKRNSLRIEKRSQKLNENFNERMREWQEEQEKLRQNELNAKQQQFDSQITQNRAEAEKSEQAMQRQMHVEPEPSMHSDTVTKLREVGNTREKETREKAIARLQEIRERYTKDRESTTKSPVISPREPEESVIQVQRVENVESNPSMEYTGYNDPDNRHIGGISDRERKLRAKQEEIRRMTAELELEQRQLAEEQQKTQSQTNSAKSEDSPRDTPSYSDVYKYYDEDLPTNLGARDPSPPPMSRNDVLKMNKKTTPSVFTSGRQNTVRESSPQPQVVMRDKRSPVKSSEAPREKAQRQQQLADRRKSAPAKPHWMREEEPENSDNNRASGRGVGNTDVDPNLPSTLSKDDVLKMMREKPRYGGAGMRRKSAITPKTQASVPEQPKPKTVEPVAAAPKSTRGFFSSRAMFEQQSQQAEREWEQRQTELNRPKKTSVPKMFSVAERKTSAPALKQNRSKSMDVRSLNTPKGDVVRGSDKDNAAYERMRELEMMRNLREEEVQKAEEDEKERRMAERRIRDERQRELQAIRQMNRQYESENRVEAPIESQRRPSDRNSQLDDARKRMAREAEQLARHQMEHAREVKQIYGHPDPKPDTIQRPDSSDEESRVTQDMVELDHLAQADALALRRHKEMIEQSKREKARRAEAETIGSQKRRQEPLHSELQRAPAPQQPALYAEERSNSKPNGGFQADNAQPRREAPEAQVKPSVRVDSYQTKPPQGYGDPIGKSSGPAPWERVTQAQLQPQPTQNGGRSYSPYSDQTSRVTNPPQAPYNHKHQGSYQSANSDLTDDTDKYNNYSPPQTQNRSSLSSQPANQSQAAFQSNSQPQNSYQADKYQRKPPYQPSGHSQAVYKPEIQSQSQSKILNGHQYNNAPEGRSNGQVAPAKPARSDVEDPVTVSAKYNCTYCTKELGKGAAMVIESLGLYYHIDCFRCCVCHTLLSNGQMGADVRVRGNRIHCKNCYSNDNAGIKYSAV